MNNTNELFALGNEHNVQITPHFIGAIIENSAGLRQSRCLLISSENLGWLNGQDDGSIIVEAPGGGMVTWFLCRYQNNLHFVFKSYTGNDTNPYIYSARETSRYEVDNLLYSQGGGIINEVGHLQLYDEIAGPQPVPEQDIVFDFDAVLDYRDEDQNMGRYRSRSDDNDQEDENTLGYKINRTH